MQKNSLYVSERRKTQRRRRKYLFSTLAVVVLVLLYFFVQWFLFHSPLFRVDKVIVQGNNSVASGDVTSLVESSTAKEHGFLKGIFGFNNMLGWPSQIATSDLTAIPQLASLSINKDYFAHTVTINTNERIPFGVWCFTKDGSCFWFDDTGTIFERSFDTQGSLIYTVNDRAQPAREFNQKILADDFVPNMISIMQVLRKSGLGVKEIDLNDLTLQEVDVLTTNGPTLYFSLRFPADNYLGYIQKMMSQPGFNKIGYIDCRTQNRIYYK